MTNSEKKNHGVTISHGTDAAHKRSFAQPSPKALEKKAQAEKAPVVEQTEEEKLKALEKNSKTGKKYPS